MREIRFRVWDNVDYMSKPFTLQDISLGKIGWTKDCPVMQFTGLKDKNGKDIYEGDIMKNWGSVIGVVQMGNGGEYLFYCSIGADKKILSIWDKTDQLEIVGNIYENPELIKTLNV